MNILIISHSYYPNLGGVEIVIDKLSKQFIKKGHRVEIITSRWPKTLPKLEYINGVKVTRLPFRLPSYNPISFLKFVVRAIECMISLFFVIRREKFDLINLHYVSENAAYALILSYLKHLPLITNIHGNDIEDFSLRNSLNKWIVRQTLKKSTLAIVNSQAMCEVISRIFGRNLNKNTIVINNGVDITNIDPSVKNQSLKNIEHLSVFILGIGRFVYKKGFDVLIKAFAFVKREFPNMMLVLVGDGLERGRLETICKDLGLKESVLFCGLMDNKDVPKILTNCEFFVLPSRKEPFGIVILEAMAAKKAVIAMDVGGVPEIVQDRKNGLLVKNHTHRALADSMIYLLENPEFASALGKNGRKLVESRYTWAFIADRYIEAFQSVYKRSSKNQ